MTILNDILFWCGIVIGAALAVFTLARIAGFAAHRGWDRYQSKSDQPPEERKV